MKGILIILLFLLSQSLMGQNSKPSADKTLPDIMVFNLDGYKGSLHQLAYNKITIIDCWFIPCGPCFAEMGMLHRLYDIYKTDTAINFMTITFSDSAFVRDLVNNRNSDSNDVYTYFRTTAKLDSFRLPVYFVDGFMTPMRSFKMNSQGKGFTGRNWPGKGDIKLQPDKVFSFEAYPTILIYDKSGQLVFSRTGFSSKGEAQEMKEIRKYIAKLLAANGRP